MGPLEQQCTCGDGEVLDSLVNATDFECKSLCDSIADCTCAELRRGCDGIWTCNAMTSSGLSLNACVGCDYSPAAWLKFGVDNMGGNRGTATMSESVGGHWCSSRVNSTSAADAIGVLRSVQSGEECTRFCMEEADCSCVYSWMEHDGWACYATSGGAMRHVDVSGGVPSAWMKLYL